MDQRVWRQWAGAKREGEGDGVYGPTSSDVNAVPALAESAARSRARYAINAALNAFSAADKTK